MASIRVVGYLHLASVVWLVVVYPSAHMRELYQWHHYTVGVQGLQPGLVDAYIRKATLLAIMSSLISPILLWLIEGIVARTIKTNFSESLLIGPILGGVSSTALYSKLNSSFQAITNLPLEDGTIFYSGLLAGLLAGELCRRYYRSRLGNQPSATELSRQLLISALMVWAVLLKILESAYLSTSTPGREPFGLHIFMFGSVLLWTPLACKALWRLRRLSLLWSVIWCIAAGLVGPLLTGLVLYVPVIFLFYAGISSSIYGVLWGAIMLLKVAREDSVLVAIAPGLTWGVIVGTLLWRYKGLRSSLYPSLPDPDSGS